MINTIKNLISKESILRKKRSWLYAVLAVTGLFLFTAAKQAPNTTITINSPEQSGVKSVIFDVGDVLLETSKLTEASLIIPIILQNPTLLYKIIRLGGINGIKKEYYNLLSTISAESTNPIYYKNQKMPLIMADWQSGLKAPQEIKQLVDNVITNSKFSIAEKHLFYGISNIMFIPENLVYSQTLILPMAKLLKKFKEAGYRVCILSNWDEDSFACVYKKYPKLFDLCDEVFISGKEKVAKPNPEFYKKLLDKCNLNPTECIFIDDQPHNIATARELRFKAIEHKNSTETCKELIKCGLLKLTIQNQ
jgi:FMN phosphatase YigB (HAD superfamily)